MDAGAIEALRYNPSNPVTAGIWRVAYGDGTAIRKVISGSRPASHPDWAASEDRTSWLYWRREAEFYASALPSRLLGTGLRAPELLALRELPDGEIELLLEDVKGRTGATLLREDLVDAVFRLGRAQARLHLEPVRLPWLSCRALRDHCASKHVDEGLLEDPEAWRHPLVVATWPDGLRPGLVRLHAQRERLFSLVEAAPRTIGHLDFWSHNLIATPTETVAVDWAFAGVAALGEDLANLIAESVLDLFVDASELDGLDALLFDAYVDGLRAEGFHGDSRLVRLGQCAASVKWHWLGALHLERAQTGEHHLYGGAPDLDPRHQYQQRGAALAWLVKRADEALALGAALGL